MKEIKVFIKRTDPKAQIPKKTYQSDAAYDVVATSITETENYIQYGIGLAFQISPMEENSWFISFRPRSSISNYDLILCNSPGTVDRNYQNEVYFRFKKTKENGKFYQIGDRIGQMILQKSPEIEFDEVKEFAWETDRGLKGFGSTGK